MQPTHEFFKNHDPRGLFGYSVPMVVEQTSRGERGYDVLSLLLKNRIVLLGTPIDDVVANLIVAQLLYLAQDDPDREIQMYINSPGGQIDAGLAIYDTMHLIQQASAGFQGTASDIEVQAREIIRMNARLQRDDGRRHRSARRAGRA